IWDVLSGQIVQLITDSVMDTYGTLLVVDQRCPTHANDKYRKRPLLSFRRSPKITASRLPSTTIDINSTIHQRKEPFSLIDAENFQCVSFREGLPNRALNIGNRHVCARLGMLYP